MTGGDADSVTIRNFSSDPQRRRRSLAPMISVRRRFRPSEIRADRPADPRATQLDHRGH
jgi:hypothetical protein